MPERLKAKVLKSGVLAVLLYGCVSWCPTADSITRLCNLHNKRISWMCHVTMLHTYAHRITPKGLQKRTGFVSLENELGSQTLLWPRACPRTAYRSASCCRGRARHAPPSAKK